MTGSFIYLILFITGAALGGWIGVLFARQRPSPQLQQRVLELTAQNAALQATLERDQVSAAEKIAVLDAAREQLANAFKALSAEALQTNNQQFLELARTQLENFDMQANLMTGEAYTAYARSTYDRDARMLAEIGFKLE